jgi:hypothetical protein
MPNISSEVHEFYFIFTEEYRRKPDFYWSRIYRTFGLSKALLHLFCSGALSRRLRFTNLDWIPKSPVAVERVLYISEFNP